MFRIKPAARLAITIGFVSLSLICLAMGLNLIPDPREAEADKRVSIVRSMATCVSTYAEHNRSTDLQRLLDRMVTVEPRLKSLGLKRKQGDPFTAGPHVESWKGTSQDHSALDHVSVEIFCNNQKWGELEMVFQQGGQQSSRSLLGFPGSLIAFLCSTVTLATWYVLHRTFRYLNPSTIVPDRVRSALDSIASGLAMITPTGEIAHANKAFGKIVRQDPDGVVGQKIDAFDWALENDIPNELPWDRTRRFKEAISGEVVEARFHSGVAQKYMVNSTPICNASGQLRGMLVSFEDVTALEAKKAELAKIIQTVRQSRDEVQRQNEQLNFLANYDSLTRCMNRRSFYMEFERLWGRALKHPLTVMIMDIDYFKKINDNHGHATGDEVLRTLGQRLHDTIGDRGTVCRYGGEEFTCLLPDRDFKSCCALAEEVRVAIEREPIAGLNVTTSIGISNQTLGAVDPQTMLDQADQCLYVAKRNGRNQVVRFDQMDQYPNAATPSASPSETPINEPSSSQRECAFVHKVGEIEYSAVTGLLSALSYRSSETAEHSIRVADLAVDIGREFLSGRELYYLEIAALMHDIGKIGVPDSVLNKPAQLTGSEWEVMKRHEEIGIAIVESSFSCAPLTETIQHYFTLRNHPKATSETRDSKQSVIAQILYVCDAFDSMTSDSVYRRAKTSSDALSELQKNTPGQFSREVVSALMNYVEAGRLRPRQVMEPALLRPYDVYDRYQPPEDSVPENVLLPDHQPDEMGLEKLIALADEVASMTMFSGVESSLSGTFQLQKNKS